jgi:hypothetical protein
VVAVVQLPKNLWINNMFEKYAAYLDGDFSVDYWSDLGIDHASTFLEKFTDSDWISLASSIQLKPIMWLVRCAETLGDINGKESFNVLIKLIEVESDEVKISALDSINSHISYGLSIGEYSDKISFAIISARRSAGKVTSIMLDSLEKELV